MKAKKIFKGMTAAAIAATLAASLVPMTAFAAEGGTLTVTATTGVSAEDTIKCYKVASLDNDGKYVWTWNGDIFQAGKVPSDTFDADAISGYNELQTKQFAADLARRVILNSTDAITLTLGQPAPLAEDGYYLVLVTAGDKSDKIYQPMLWEVKDGQDQTISAVKSSEIPFEKKITAVGNTEGSGATNTDDAAQVKIGDTISFQLKTQIPSYDPNIKKDLDLLNNFKTVTITDTPTNMTINRDSIKVYLSDDDVFSIDDDKILNTMNSNYHLTLEDGNAKPAEIKLDASKIVLADENNDGVADNAGKYVFVTLDATLDSTANIETANPNEAKVSYGNDYATGSTAKEKDDDVAVFTTKLVINKKDDKGAVLKGAEFTLTQTKEVYNAEEGKTETVVDYTTTITTGDDGVASVAGLSAGTYILTETKAPAGFKLDSTPRTIVIDKTTEGKTVKFTSTSANVTHNDTNKQFETEVINYPGQQLPGTGGMGTTLFTIGGAGVVLLAGGLLAFYMKKRRTEEEE